MGWPPEGSPPRSSLSDSQGHPSPKHIPPQRVKKREKERELGKQIPRSQPPGVDLERRPGGWQGAGTTPRPSAQLGAPTGTVTPAPGAGVVEQPGFPGALPDTAPPHTREINITAVRLPASGQKQPQNEAANVTAVSQCVPHMEVSGG